MGEVYLAHDRRSNTRVALKVLPIDIGTEVATARRRFIDEANAARLVTHDNVIRTYGFAEDHGHLYLWMEYFKGQTLAQVLFRRQRLTLAETRFVLAQVADALGAVHAAGVVHRDLKPENLLIDEQGRLKLIDFGLARAPFTRGLTAPSLIIGTPEYMAPEQVRGEPVDARTDLYALGCLAYHLLAGVPPFEAETPLGLAFRHCIDTARPLSEHCPEVPPLFAAAVHRALSKDPASRFGSAAEMKKALLARSHPGYLPVGCAAPVAPARV
jgi:serine/threonine-protein kinase